MSLAKSGGQYQVVVGSDVPNVYRALEGLLDLDEVSKESSEKQDRTPLQSFLALISGIFTPILPKNNKYYFVDGKDKEECNSFWDA